MDEKTAAIPSLKEFKEQQKERSAQSARTGSMQTKGQMRRSSASHKQSTSKTPARTPSRTSAGLQRTQRTSSQSGRPVTGNSASERRTETRSNMHRSADITRGKPEQRRQQMQRTDRRSVQSAPDTYARERNSASQSRKPQAVIKKKPSAASHKNSKKGNKPLSHRMRKIRNFFVYLSIILVVLLIGVILSLTVLFKTNNIKVNGLEDVSLQQDIIESSGLSFGDNIFTAPKSRAEKRIENKFPFIEKAEVSSSFPDTINIDITIATPACVVEGLGGYYIVSDKGKVLEVSATDDEAGVPIIEGEGIGKQTRAAGEFLEFESDIVKGALSELFGAFKEYGCKSITAINIKAEEKSFALKYVYDNRIVVYLGLPEHISYKVQVADKIIRENIEVYPGSEKPINSMIAGELDVSMCYDTMKSYFNEYSYLVPQVAPQETEATETQPTETVEEYVYE